MVLPFIWFLLVGLLIAGYALLDGFDLGTGILYPFIAKNEAEKKALRTSIGPVWDGNEVWLLAGGGALFAAFPKVYATVFSGFYLAMMLVLFCLILRAVSLEFRQPGNKAWDWVFFASSTVAALLFGVALGNAMRGIPIDAAGEFSGTFWTLLNPFSLLIGIVAVSMLVSHGAHWVALRTDGDIQKRAAKVRSVAHWVFVALLIVATIVVGLAVKDQSGRVAGNPGGWVMLLIIVAGIVVSRVSMMRKRDGYAFIGSGVTILGLIGLVGVGNYPNLVPALNDPTHSLTVQNSASSHLTLMVMGIIALIGVPIVLGYTAFIYRTFRGRIVPDKAAAEYGEG